MLKNSQTLICALGAFVCLLIPTAASAEGAGGGLQLIELDDFSNDTTISGRALKILSVKLDKASRRSVIDETKLNDGLRASLRGAGLFKRILEPWQEDKDPIKVMVVANERDPIVTHNNDFRLYPREGLEIPIPGNRPTYNLDGELKIILRFLMPEKVFEFSCWTTSDYDVWRGDFNGGPKLGKRLIADCTNELIKNIKRDAKFIQEISAR